MKKLLWIPLLIASVFVHAQDYSNLIMLTGGVALPAGKFGGTNLNFSSDLTSGFAKTGFSGNLIFQHKIKKLKFFGYSASVRLQNFSFDKDAFSKAFNASSTEATNWIPVSILVGPMWTFSLSNKIAIEPFAQAGVMFVRSPRVTAYSEGNFEAPSESAKSFSYLAGFNVRFDLWKRISLFARVDYQSAKPKFSYPNSTTGWAQSIQSINGMLGAGFRF